MNHQLVLKDVTVSYSRIPAVHHLSASVACGSCVALLGPNGAGKTTLLKAIAGLLPLETGHIRFEGHEIGAHPSRAIAYVPQREAVDWDFPITVRGLVEMGRYPQTGWWRKYRASDQTAVDQALHLLDLDNLQDRQIRELSGGQQQRLCIARALAIDPEILLFDEPTSALDGATGQKVMGLIRELTTAKEHVVIVVTHDERIYHFADRIAHRSGRKDWLLRENSNSRAASAMYHTIIGRIFTT